jgi:hypothetical protein
MSQYCNVKSSKKLVEDEFFPEVKRCEASQVASKTMLFSELVKSEIKEKKRFVKSHSAKCPPPVITTVINEEENDYFIRESMDCTIDPPSLLNEKHGTNYFERYDQYQKKISFLKQKISKYEKKADQLN